VTIRILLFLGVLVFNSFTKLFHGVHSYDQPIRLLTVGGDGIVLLLAVSAAIRHWHFYGVRYFVAFLACSLFTLAYNLDRIGAIGYLNGLREPAFFFLCLIVIHDFFESSHGEKLERIMAWLLLAVAVIQIPVAWRQFQEYGMNDFVGGTFGFAGAGILSLVLFLISFFAIVRFGSLDEGTHFSLFTIALCSILLFPTAINETKISFVLLGIYLTLLLFSRKIFKAIPIMALGVLLFVLLNTFYSEFVKDTSKLMDVQFLERYLLFDERQSVDIPRFQKLGITFDMMAGDPVTYLIGFGYGLFMGGNILEMSSFGRAIQFLHGARSYINTLGIQGGLLGLLWTALAMFHFVFSPHVRSQNMKKLRMFVVFVLAILWLYADAMLNRFFAATVAFLVLWIERGGIDEDEPTDDGAQEGHDSEGKVVEDEETTVHQ